MAAYSPKVSIIVPNYNYGRFLPERMRSIMAQTYTDYELILLDDCSTDNSQQLFRAYETLPKVSHVVVNSENSGSPMLQWFRGIALAKGELVWIAEADDSSEPTFLATLVERMAQQSLSFAFCRSVIIDDSGNRQGILQRRRKRDLEWKGTSLIRQRLAYTNSIITNASAVVFRREAALNVMAQYKHVAGTSGDWLFWIMMARQGRVAMLSSALNQYRRHGNNITRKNTSNGQNYLGNRQIFRYLRDERLIGPLQAVNIKRRMAYNLLYNAPQLTSEVRQQILAEWRIGLPYRAMAAVQHPFHKKKNSTRARIIYM